MRAAHRRSIGHGQRFDGEGAFLDVRQKAQERRIPEPHAQNRPYE
jgi:hypothetical protein